MSEIEKTEGTSSGKEIVHKIDISASKREKELEQAKDSILIEKAKLEQELERLKEQYDGEVRKLKEEYEKISKDFEDVAKQRDEYAQKFTALAMKRFEGEKKAIFERAQKAGLPPEKIKEMEEKITNPEELDRWKYTLDTMIEYLSKGKEAYEKEENNPPPPPSPEQKGAGGAGKATLPQSSTSGFEGDLMKKVFNSPKEMIDYLYMRVAKGKTVTRQVSDGKGGFKTVEERVGPDVEAEKVLNELWRKYIQSEKASGSGRKTYVMCPRCKGMYDSNYGTCPLCGVPLTVGPDAEPSGIQELK